MATTKEAGITIWLPIHWLIGSFMFIGIWNAWDWGLVQTARDDGNLGRTVFFVFWLCVATIWAIFVALPLVKNLLEGKHFIAYTVTVLIIIGGAVLFALWSGLLNPDNYKIIVTIAQLFAALVLAVSNSMASAE